MQEKKSSKQQNPVILRRSVENQNQIPKFPYLRFYKTSITYSGELSDADIRGYLNLDAGNLVIQNPEVFIKSLTISKESKEMITIQAPGKTPIPFSCRSLGFKNDRTQSWKFFLKMLSEEGTCYIGIPDTKDYYNNKEWLKEIDVKLLQAFKDFYHIRFPKSFHIYKHQGKGSYKFKFQCGLRVEKSEYSSWEDNDLLSEKIRLQGELEKRRTECVRAKIENVYTEINRRKLMLQNEIEKEIYELNLYEPEQGYDKYENRKKEPKDY